VRPKQEDLSPGETATVMTSVETSVDNRFKVMRDDE
jgi:hypothetical protein